MPDTVPSDGLKRRAALQKACANASREAANLAEFEQAIERARSEGWDLSGQLEHAQQTLTDAERAEPARLARAFTKRDKDSFPSPVYAAQESLVKIQEAVEQNDRLQKALQHEVEEAQSRLRTLRPDFYIALADFVVHAPEYIALQNELRNAFFRLRSVRASLDAVHQALHGQVPQSALDQSQIVEPLQARTGYPVDQALVDSWSKALDALVKGDLDAPLPSI